MATKMIAPSSGWPTREIELLIADPSPEKRPGIELISVLVSGRHDHRDPEPEEQDRRAARRSDVEPAGRASPASRRPPSTAPNRPAAGRTRASPTAISSGPATRNRRAPSRPASVPTRVDSSDSMIPTGMPDRPGAERRVAEHALEQQRLVADRDVQRAVDEERRQVDRRERPLTEQPERDERVGAPGHQDREERRARRRRSRSRSRPPCPPSRCAWPRISPNARPPTASAATTGAEPVEPPGRVRRRATRRRGASVAHSAIASSGTLIRKATRQPIVSTITPPTIGPRTVSADVDAAQIPNARPRAAPSNAWVMSDSEPGHEQGAGRALEEPEDDQPLEVGARPHSAEVTANPASPIA